jgi:2-amino-4-hydroxy-6-hydroxymethyldihydropteridine diphosphokinase
MLCCVPQKEGECAKGLVRLLLATAVLILVGIGSNRGDRLATMRASIDALRGFAAGVFRTSSLWRTSPVDCPPDSGDFINAVVAFEPRAGLTPEALLAELKRLEREFGRVEQPVRNAPRELDLDLLMFGSLQRDGAAFQLPHPRATQRRFVLAPAAEVAPDLCWPGQHLTVSELLGNLDSNEHVERLCAAALDP